MGEAPKQYGRGAHALMQAQLEQTIAGSIAFSGIGLHSGAPVHLRLLPAAAGTGIVFRRTDLDNFEIQAIGRNVAKVAPLLERWQARGLSHLIAGKLEPSADGAVVLPPGPTRSR